MKEEIKDNSGFHNSYIEDFCTNNFLKNLNTKQISIWERILEVEILDIFGIRHLKNA